MLRDWNIIPWEYHFMAPYWLLLLLLVPLVFWWRHRQASRRQGNFKFTRETAALAAVQNSSVRYLLWLRNVLLAGCTSLLILALARPTHYSGYDDYEKKYKYGIDMILAMDISLSMLARDFEPNRLEAAKRVACDFIDGREGDRIGLVVYEGEAYTACPATLDYSILKKQIKAVQPGFLEDGTAIGIGLGTAVTRLRNDSLQSKVIILLTDGVNNVGDLSPIDAAYLAKSKNIRVYTIGMGSNGTAPSPQFTPFGIRYVDAPVEIDEATLTKIAVITDGKYFRAHDEAALKTIYKEIEKMEKRRITDQQFKTEPPVRPLPFLNWALLMMLLAFGLQTFYFRTHG